MTNLRIAVIGVGHLGKEHARILAGLRDIDLVGVADVNVEQAGDVAARTDTVAYADYNELLDAVDAVTVVVPTTYHHRVAGAFLQRGIPVLVEKPLASTLAEAEELVEMARQNNAILQVGHIERFNPAFEEMQRRAIQPKFITAERAGPFTGRSTDIGVVLDLMIHDLDLLLALVDSPVQSVESVGISLLSAHEDVANARLHFANGCIADVTASRASSNPARRMHIWAAEGYGSIDFKARHLTLVQASPQLHQQRRARPSLAMPSGRRKIDGAQDHLQTLKLDCNHGDQLTRELEHFADSVRAGATPRVSGKDGLRAMALADRVLDGIRDHRWDGRVDGPVGPHSLPAPLGHLFQPLSTSDAA